MGETEKEPKPEIELPQSIVDPFARFLVPEIWKFYESEEGKRALAEWEAQQDNENVH